VIGDHKGYGLALILEVLSGVLTGAGFGQAHAPERLQTAAAPYDLGHLFAVLDPTLFMPLEEFTARMEQLRHEIKQGQRAPGVDRLLLPGELEDERRTARQREGIKLDPDVLEALRQFCATLGINFPLATR
jgi:LDH2 family malate/lactate/ureidoglycolate dehydrogenase